MEFNQRHGWFLPLPKCAWTFVRWNISEMQVCTTSSTTMYMLVLLQYLGPQPSTLPVSLLYTGPSQIVFWSPLGYFRLFNCVSITALITLNYHKPLFNWTLEPSSIEYIGPSSTEYIGALFNWMFGSSSTEHWGLFKWILGSSSTEL